MSIARAASPENNTFFLDDDKGVTLIIRPDIEDRSFHETVKAFKGPEKEWPKAVTPFNTGFNFLLANGKTLRLAVSKGEFVHEPEWHYMIHHSLEAQRGLDAESDLEGRKVVVIEDLISTGGSSARAVEAVREANGVADWCISIFSYGLGKAAEQFAALDPPCQYTSLLTFPVLLEAAKEGGFLSEEQIALLAAWREDPFGWGEKHGFPKVEK